jgi:hypothetical protein
MVLRGQRVAVALSQTLQGYYARLLKELGPQGWWPARTRLEVVLGTVLTQNTSWQNVSCFTGGGSEALWQATKAPMRGVSLGRVLAAQGTGNRLQALSSVTSNL